jgi:hypothetical protein
MYWPSRGRSMLKRRRSFVFLVELQGVYVTPFNTHDA